MRYVEIGQVWKEGSKWRTGVDTQSWKSKKIATALIEGTECLRRARGESAPMEGEPDDGEFVDEWPTWAAWPKDTRLKSVKYGNVGMLDDAFIQRRSKQRRYSIYTTAKVWICGAAKDFKEVDDE
jgi:hypothetical protein